MTHIELKQGPDDVGMRLLVDGIDLSRQVLRDGFSIRPGGPSGYICDLRIICDTADIDIPGLEVTARADGSATLRASDG